MNKTCTINSHILNVPTEVLTEEASFYINEWNLYFSDHKKLAIIMTKIINIKNYLKVSRNNENQKFQILRMNECFELQQFSSTVKEQLCTLSNSSGKGIHLIHKCREVRVKCTCTSECKDNL